MKKYMSIFAVVIIMLSASLAFAGNIENDPYYQQEQERAEAKAAEKARYIQQETERLRLKELEKQRYMQQETERLRLKEQSKLGYEQSETERLKLKEYEKSLMEVKLKAGKSGISEEEALKMREEFKKRVLAEQEAFRAKIKDMKTEFNAEVKAKKEEFKNASGEVKRKFWDNAQNMIGQRFESAFTNLERMQTRVGDLIEKLDGEGKDTGAAGEYLDDSTAKLADAKAKLAEVKKLLPATGEQVTAEAFEKIKLGARETKDLVKESHNALVQAIKELKGLRGEKEQEDSTTTTTTSSINN